MDIISTIANWPWVQAFWPWALVAFAALASIGTVISNLDLIWSKIQLLWNSTKPSISIEKFGLAFGGDYIHPNYIVPQSQRINLLCELHSQNDTSVTISEVYIDYHKTELYPFDEVFNISNMLDLSHVIHANEIWKINLEFNHTLKGRQTLTRIMNMNRLKAERPAQLRFVAIDGTEYIREFNKWEGKYLMETFAILLDFNEMYEVIHIHEALRNDKQYFNMTREEMIERTSTVVYSDHPLHKIDYDEY